MDIFTMNLKVSEIIVEDRVRTDYGDLSALEQSIKELGVIQPIGVISELGGDLRFYGKFQKRLIYGARRLQACKNLGRDTIPARIITVETNDPITELRMERDENEHRKDLTPSEKVELAMRIEEVLAGRQGGDRKSSDKILSLNQGQSKSVERTHVQLKSSTPLTLSPVGRSDEIAAKAVDMNRETYRQAKAVVNSGNQAAINAMDKGEKSINAAYTSIKKTVTPQTFKITLTLHNNPAGDAEVLLAKGGSEYCTKLALAMLKAAGHQVEI